MCTMNTHTQDTCEQNVCICVCFVIITIEVECYLRYLYLCQKAIRTVDIGRCLMIACDEPVTVISFNPLSVTKILFDIHVLNGHLNILLNCAMNENTTKQHCKVSVKGRCLHVAVSFQDRFDCVGPSDYEKTHTIFIRIDALCAKTKF